MNEREADPTGAFHGGGAAGTEPDAPGPTARGDRAARVDDAEREVITSGTAATSEIGDPAAQRDAEAQGDGTPLPEG